MLNRLRAFFFWERRKVCAAPAIERRQGARMSRHAANAQLDASIERFTQTVIRKRDTLTK